MLAESLFRVFDEDKSGSLSFEEWVEASQAPALDTTEEKLSWIFTAFDSDGGGSIDYEEITDICQVELQRRFANFSQSRRRPLIESAI